MNPIDQAARKVFDKLPRTHDQPARRRQLAFVPDDHAARQLEALMNCDEAMADVLKYGHELAEMGEPVLNTGDLMHLQQMRHLVLQARRRVERK